MLSMPIRSVVAQALRAGSHGLPAKSLSARVAVVGRSFLVAPSYKSRVAARGFATATAKKTTTAKKPAAKKTAKKPAAKKAASKKSATATKAKKKTKKAAAKPKKAAAKKPVNPERQKILLRRELKRAALLNQEPKNLPASAWLVFTSQAIKSDTSVRGPSTLGPKMQSLAVEFRSLSSSEKQVCATVVPNALRVPVLTLFISISSKRPWRTRQPMRPTTRSGWRVILWRKLTRQLVPESVSTASST